MSSVANTGCDVVAAARNDLMYWKEVIIISYYYYKSLSVRPKEKKNVTHQEARLPSLWPTMGMVY